MIRAYLRERFPVWFFGPLAVLLALAALGRPTDAGELAAASAAGLLLLLQFRIWDDIADRTTDAVAHPRRVTAQATSLAPLAALGTALFVVNIWIAVGRDATSVSLLLLAALHVALGGFYLLRRGRTVLGDQLLLAKYPVFIGVLAAERLLDSPTQVALTAALAYAAASAYEAWHDPVSPLAQFLGGRS